MWQIVVDGLKGLATFAPRTGVERDCAALRPVDLSAISKWPADITICRTVMFRPVHCLPPALNGLPDDVFASQVGYRPGRVNGSHNAEHCSLPRFTRLFRWIFGSGNSDNLRWQRATDLAGAVGSNRLNQRLAAISCLTTSERHTRRRPEFVPTPPCKSLFVYLCSCLSSSLFPSPEQSPRPLRINHSAKTHSTTC